MCVCRDINTEKRGGAKAMRGSQESNRRGEEERKEAPRCTQDEKNRWGEVEGATSHTHAHTHIYISPHRESARGRKRREEREDQCCMMNPLSSLSRINVCASVGKEGKWEVKGRKQQCPLLPSQAVAPWPLSSIGFVNTHTNNIYLSLARSSLDFRGGRHPLIPLSVLGAILSP